MTPSSSPASPVVAVREMPPANRGRVAAGFMTVALMALLVAASLSDRVPILLKRARTRLPLPDIATSTSSGWGVHFFGWIVVTFFAVQVARRWRWRFVITAALLAFGWLIEILQNTFTQIRHYEIVDLTANLRGVAVGFTAAACYLTLRSWRGAPDTEK
jgi:VanZ family protein